MLYLVTIEYIEPGPTYALEGIAKMVERTIVPSLEAIANMEKEGTIRAGGVHAASRASALIVDAKDHTHLSQVLQGLPFWSLMKVRVTPLQSFAERAKQERQAVEFLNRSVEQAADPW